MIGYLVGWLPCCYHLGQPCRDAIFASIDRIYDWFFPEGSQMPIGLCGAEIVGRCSVGASEGFLGWIAYLGAANAGVPLSLLVQQYGWDAFFPALLLVELEYYC